MSSWGDFTLDELSSPEGTIHRPWMGKEFSECYTVDDWILRLGRVWIPPEGYQYVQTEKPEGWGVDREVKLEVQKRERAIWGGCPMCGEKHVLQVHHLHYRSYCQESIWDLLALCDKCHRAEHWRPNYMGSDTEIWVARRCLGLTAERLGARREEAAERLEKVKEYFAKHRRLDRWFAKTTK